ncbi:MAG TPA: LON peptidase substrate-binding domain-containing protein, partial [Burkholderiaceae bacterium]|nr:LON peptidase substrate-binding domain-containing protein [Burkholderiaceae bacterium]
MNYWPLLQQTWSGDESGRAGGAKSSAASSAGAPVKPLPKDAVVIIPLRNAVVFPGTLSPLTVGRAASVAAAQEAVKNELQAGFLLQRDPQKADVVPSDL